MSNRLLADPVVAEALAWPRNCLRLAAGLMRSGLADPVFLASVQFLARYRRPGIPPDAVTAVVGDEVRPGDRLGRAAEPTGGVLAAPAGQGAALRLLWQRRVSTDLSRPLDAGRSWR